VTEPTDENWQTGQRISVRGQLWTIVERARFGDCEALRLTGAQTSESSASRTILLPFDRPRRLPSSSSIQVLRPRRWLAVLRQAALDARPFGCLSAAASSTIDFLPYQLEPALAMLGDGYTRIMIADAVGLGKTIQAGLILGDLAAAREAFRALVVTPAGLREQWAGELADHFGIKASIATSPWLARVVNELPADVNPWALPGVYISSFDLIKRPEVLRPLEEIDWDLVVVDEAHAATLGSARRAAVHAVALRARRVLLLTATPHGGDQEQFRALCRIGQSEQSPQPLMIFRRSRGDIGASNRRRTVLLPVRPSEAERRMHRLLERYTSRVCAESRARGDREARLAAIVLRKRALSSAASLAVSCRRRLVLLGTIPMTSSEHQLPLPLGDEEAVEDVAPDSILGAPGLADAARERRWLESIVEAAEDAARDESKIGLLARLLRRMKEPAIVFTEYRDTLERIRDALRPSHPNVSALHGGMTAPERLLAHREFNARGSLLLATDAASEGLNLHHRCRTVIHFELPWSPSRIEQRTGRVDRIGQARAVHEIMLVANDTAERLVLAPLARRAARAGTSVSGGSRLLDVLVESRVAAAVMEGETLEASAAAVPVDCIEPGTELRAAAGFEASRLSELRNWRSRAHVHPSEAAIAATALRTRRGILFPGIVAVYRLSLASGDGSLLHSEVIAFHERGFASARPRTPADLRAIVRSFSTRAGSMEQAILTHVDGHLKEVAARCATASAALAAREQAIATPRLSASRLLVQGGLFDQRAVRAAATRSRAAATLLEETHQQVDALMSRSHLAPALGLIAILVSVDRARA
jgi:ERCC4-related helicase